jgi:tRNA-dihydrouridine synthase B
MAGYTEYPFRSVVAGFGCPLAVTPLVSARGLTTGNRSSSAILSKGVDDADIVAGQVFGAEPPAMVEAARIVADIGYDIVDINLGCSTRKINRQSAGAVLTSDTKLLRGVIRAVVKASPVPVTAKIRIGISEDNINGPEVARLLEDDGVQCVAVHGRTSTQGFSGRSDPDRIAEVVDAVDVPVIANGDVTSVASAAGLIERTGAAAVMIGRAALREPELIARADVYIRTGVEPPLADSDTLAGAYIRLFDLTADIYGEERAAKIIRKFLINLMKGFAGAKRLRKKGAAVSSREECLNVVNELQKVRTADRDPSGEASISGEECDG